MRAGCHTLTLLLLHAVSPNVQIRRGPNSYRYSESIVIHGGGSYSYSSQQLVSSPQLFSPLLTLAILFGAAYAFLTARFLKNFESTVFKRGSGWKLALLWPVLFAGSPSFRQEFLAAVKGQRPQKQEQGGPTAE